MKFRKGTGTDSGGDYPVLKILTELAEKTHVQKVKNCSSKSSTLKERVSLVE